MKKEKELEATNSLWEDFVSKLEGWNELSEEDLQKLAENWAMETSAWYYRVEILEHLKVMKLTEKF